MSMTTSNHGGPAAEMNVTPLIDVLLVLLIIYMVITPLKSSGLDALVPQPPDKSNPPPEVRTIVVQVLGNASGEPTLKVNDESVSWENMTTRLRTIFSTRAERVLFIKGDDTVTFDSIAQVIDLAHSAGVDKIGLITAKIEAGR